MCEIALALVYSRWRSRSVFSFFLQRRLRASSTVFAEMPSRLGHVACQIRESTLPLQIASSGTGRRSEFADFENENDEEEEEEEDNNDVEDVDTALPVTSGIPIAHSPIAMPSYSPITMPSHMRLACVKRRRSAIGCSQQPDSVPTSRRRPSEPCEATNSTPDRLPSASTVSPAPKTSSSRKELSMIWYLLQHLCWKYKLSNRVLVRAQKTLIEQYRQQKRARNLALAACCCIIYACERYNIVAPDLQQAVDFCARALAAARTDGARANDSNVHGGNCLPPSPPAVRMSLSEQQLLRQRVNERRTIIQEMVERANRRLRRAAAAASASEESSEEDLLAGGGAATSDTIQTGTCPQCLQAANGPGVFGSSPDSTISAVSAIGCTTVNSRAPCECEGNLRVQARTKRPCLMSCGTQIRRVGWRLEKNIEAEFESFQPVQGFALNLAALAAAVAATGTSTSGTPDAVLRPSTAAIDIGPHAHVDDVDPFDGQLFDSWRRRSRSDAVSC